MTLRSMAVEIAGRPIGPGHPTYFIADIAANHDGSLERAESLIRMAKAAGADAAKFQNFHAHKIVSDFGFRHLGGQMSHQSAWKKSVVEVYEDASVPDHWAQLLKEMCDDAGITFLSSPYDQAAVDLLDPLVPAFKVGSGDIDWHEHLREIARRGKPVILASGACTLGEVEAAVDVVRELNDQLVLLQCNTNYTADESNFDHLHLNVLRTYAVMWPDLVLGLSDHTHGAAAVLGAVALGASVVERHFTDDNEREGPDHKFALNPQDWAAMVAETRRLERALGSTRKLVAGNEIETAVIQRRCVRAKLDIEPGTRITRDMLVVLRPATPGAVRPDQIDRVVGKRLLRTLSSGQEIRFRDLEE